MVDLIITIKLVFTTIVFVGAIKFTIVKVSNTTHNSNAHTTAVVTSNQGT